MRSDSHRYLIVGLVAVIAVEAAMLWQLAWRDTHAEWDADVVRIAIRRIDNNRQAALEGTVQEALNSLRDIASCYADWEWQRADLKFGELIEERRVAAVREVIESLKIRTGLDFGYEPEKWIETNDVGALKRGGQSQHFLPNGE